MGSLYLPFKKMGVTFSDVRNFSSVCSWQGVICDAQEKHVTGLVFSRKDLSGSIPDATIGKLSKLQSLDLSYNRITGFSSDFWSSNTGLKNLNLSHNHFSGFLSNNIGNFVLLESLDLSCNNFSGEIPTAFSNLSILKALKLDQNAFKGIIPSGVLKCKSLVLVDLSSNQLNGNLPDGFGAAFPNLRTFNIAENKIHGKSLDFSGLKPITHLNISGNLFQGSVVDVFQGSLEVIDLSRNQFHGNISEVHFNPSFNWSNLVFLDLSGNQLSGEIFQNLNQAQNMKHLNLANNRLFEQEFSQINRLSALAYLNLSQTSLTGRIPSELSQLSSLSTLDLSENHLTGSIPSVGNRDLRIIDVSINNLTGEIPSSLLQKLPHMEKFNFSYNNLALCASQLSTERFQTAFIGSLNSCPNSAFPYLFGKLRANHKALKLILAIILLIVCLVVGLLCLAFCCRRKTRMRAVKQLSCKVEVEPNISGPFSFDTDLITWVANVKVATTVPLVVFEKPLQNFTFADLLSATSNFDHGTLLDEGRFGPVYRGCLPGAIHVAIKVLVHGSTITDQQAARALEHLGHIKHTNLVSLIGYCLGGGQRMVIYDYMENGNLNSLLHDLPLWVKTTEDSSTDPLEGNESNGVQNVGSKCPLTSWSFRHKIALGTARALAFLHHGCSPPQIHTDVKASSVYLDSNFEPRLSDFGLSVIFGNGLEDVVSRGSPGYVPPEFSQLDTGSPTVKSDVYGFGVVLFELVTGKKPVGDEYPEEKESNLVNWVRGLIRKSMVTRAIDPKIQETGQDIQMVEALKIGYLCTAELPSKRPCMQQIVGLLKDINPIVS